MQDYMRKIGEVEEMSWDALRDMAVEELSAIPKSERAGIEKAMGIQWPQFEQMMISLAGKSYDEIFPIHEKMSMLGRLTLDRRSARSRLSQAELVELGQIAMYNRTHYKSPKVLYWHMCRLLNSMRV